VEAFTPENIKTAFRKTGVHPFNPSVITQDMLAPSKETSIESHLPAKKTTTEPVMIIAEMLHDLQLTDPSTYDPASDLFSSENPPTLPRSSNPVEEETPVHAPVEIRSQVPRITRSSARSDLPSTSTSTTSVTPTQSTTTPTTSTSSTPTPTPPPTAATIKILENAVEKLRKSNLRHLVLPAAVSSSDPPPEITTRTQQEMAVTNNARAALKMEPATERELFLLTALREYDAHFRLVEAHAFEMQASNILNQAFTRRLQAQLAAKEEKKGKGKKTKLVGDGLPRMLTADDFYDLARQKEDEMEREEKEKEKRKKASEQFKVAMTQWKKQDNKRKADAAAIRAANKKASEEHKQRAAEAKAKRKTFKEKAPISLPIPKATPKPLLKDFLAQLEADDDDANADDDADDDEEVFSNPDNDEDDDDDDDD